MASRNHVHFRPTNCIDKYRKHADRLDTYVIVRIFIVSICRANFRFAELLKQQTLIYNNQLTTFVTAVNDLFKRRSELVFMLTV